MFRWQNADVAAVLAFVLEEDDAVNLGEERVVLPAANIEAGLVTCAPLADQNRSGADQFAAETLYAEPLPGRVAAVY